MDLLFGINVGFSGKFVAGFCGRCLSEADSKPAPGGLRPPGAGFESVSERQRPQNPVRKPDFRPGSTIKKPGVTPGTLDEPRGGSLVEQSRRHTYFPEMHAAHLVRPVAVASRGMVIAIDGVEVPHYTFAQHAAAEPAQTVS